MSSTGSTVSSPCLPQTLSTLESRDRRAFQLSIARTAYNYVRSYPHLGAVPLSANIPPGEGFSAGYGVILARVLSDLSENFVAAVGTIVRRALGDDSPQADIEAITHAFERLLYGLKHDSPGEYPQLIENFVHRLATLLPDALMRVSNLPFDLAKIPNGLESTLREAAAEGPTAFLKAMLFSMLGMVRIGGRDPLAAQSTAQFEDLIATLPKPLMLAIEPKRWMVGSEKPCEQDWFFGYLQVAGFNTTNLRGVTLEGAKKTVRLADLLNKIPMTNDIFRAVLEDDSVTLESAAQAGKLYVCDYAELAPPIEGSTFHGRPRFVAAPIALFYWNEEPPDGYPKPGYGDRERPGVLQPIAIQLAQVANPETAPLFTPGDHADANDQAGLKWQIAKLIVNSSCAVQHESVAHLGECHLVMGTIVLATHRQLAEEHPLFKLLAPHMRFTLSINDGAMHNLVIPGGVVATNVGTAMSSTLDLINSAREALQWDEQNPERSFKACGVAGEGIVFPFRDDTLLVWKAIKSFVRDYLGLYYKTSLDVRDDHELQAWVNELTDPQCGAFQGMNGLVWDKQRKRWRIDSFEYLTELVAQVLYTAGPKHAAVNYPQYPLGSYAPSVAASVYAEPPSKSQTLSTPEQCLPWYLPLDVALYAISFEYLLSGVQYDRLGYYDTDPGAPYFAQSEVQDVVAKFQAELARIELVIRERNPLRPMPYCFQLPSQIPNSISI